MIIRPAQEGDRDLFYTMRNDPEAARMSRRPMFTKEEHDRWWQRTSDHRFIADADGGPVGCLRISSDGTISIVVSQGLRGRGYGAEMLTLIQPVARALGYKRMFAEVAPENIKSQRAFLKANWNPILFEVNP